MAQRHELQHISGYTNNIYLEDKFIVVLFDSWEFLMIKLHRIALSSGISILLCGLFVFTLTLSQLSTKQEVIHMIPTTGISLQLFQLNQAIYATMTDKADAREEKGE